MRHFSSRGRPPRRLGLRRRDPPPPRQGGETRAGLRSGAASYLDCGRRASPATHPPVAASTTRSRPAPAARLGCPEAPPCCREGYDLDEELLQARCDGGVEVGRGRAVPGQPATTRQLLRRRSLLRRRRRLPRARGHRCPGPRPLPPRRPGGPLIFAIAQDPIGEGGALCGSTPPSARATATSASGPSSLRPRRRRRRLRLALYQKLFSIGPPGARSLAFDLPPELPARAIRFTGCFDGANPAPQGAVQLDDDSGTQLQRPLLRGLRALIRPPPA